MMFWSIIKENKWRVMMTILLGILVSILLVRMALMLSGLIDFAVDKDLNRLLNLGGTYLISWVVVIGLGYLSDLSQAKTIQMMNESLRKKMTQKIISLDYEMYHQVDSGTYVSWLTNDIKQIEENSFNKFFTVIFSFTTVISSLIALFSTSIWVVLLSIVFCLIMSIIPKYVTKPIQKQAQLFSKAQEKFVGEIKSDLQGHEVLYSYNLLTRIKYSITRQSHQVEQIKYEFSATKSLVDSIMSLLHIISLLSNILLISVLAIFGVTTIGMIFPVTELSGNVFRNLSSLITAWTTLKSSKPLFEKFEIQKTGCPSMIECPSFNNAIELKGVSYAYENKEVFNDLSLRFEKGKKYAIVGDSGSGKTTLIKLILGHLSGYEGELYFDNVDIKGYSGESIRSQLAYISQDVYLFNNTLKDNITLDEQFSDYDFEQALEGSCLTEFVNSLPEREHESLGENGSLISGGQRQRIALARALIRQKPIIILDEGTSALDARNAFEIESKLLTNEDLTIIMITHHLNDKLRDKYDQVINLGKEENEILERIS